MGCVLFLAQTYLLSLSQHHNIHWPDHLRKKLLKIRHEDSFLPPQGRTVGDATRTKHPGDQQLISSLTPAYTLTQILREILPRLATQSNSNQRAESPIKRQPFMKTEDRGGVTCTWGSQDSIRLVLSISTKHLVTPKCHPFFFFLTQKEEKRFYLSCM